MSVVSSSLSIYQTGGSLPINAPTYVKRQADEDLYRWLKEGEFCYVLNSRQMGKSSLRVQIMAQLRKEGVACAALDLTEIGSSDITRDEWYAGVIDSLVGSFNLEENFDLEVWWTGQSLLSPSKKLSKFLSEILLINIVSPMVIFIDEIDSTLKLKFKDDFFALLRACYNQRADNQEYKRLTFCLLGVASPTNLIADQQSTPFNIGQSIDLKGFQIEEIEPLARYLQKKVDNPYSIMGDILSWTGGQPFLTQRLCSLVFKANNLTPDVSQIVQQMVIDNWEAQDEQEHLKTIKKRLLSDEQRAISLLKFYRIIVLKGKIIIKNSLEERELRLSGLVLKKGNTLQITNRIYAKIFNINWIETEIKKLDTTSAPYYQVGGDLSRKSRSYVEREADEKLYQNLKNGNFCYIFGSRQIGKSSLLRRLIQRLENEDYICVNIDLSGIGQANQEQWYNSVANRLVKGLRPYVNINFRQWREENDFLSPVKHLNQLIESVLLPAVPKDKKIIIFLDEIDYVRSLNFNCEDFFILIRSFYNQRSRNKDYNRLIFCLIGVTTPSDLIEDKQITPFTIGSAITLKGFTVNEVEPLTQGLKNEVNEPKKVIKEILHWTQGQPFLTQRLCDLVVNQKQLNPDLNEIVQRNIIDNWDDPEQDKQEHLRTIRNRILRDNSRASLLLELYRNILKEEVKVSNTKEEMELQLSGLVLKKGNVLQVYNPIYAKVFDETWIDTELNKLRPYAESYRAWLQSGKTDETRLLRGQALVDAEAWANGKNLSGEDKDFLGASWAKEREIEIERKEKESVEERNILLEAANEEANQKIKRGSLIGVGIFGIMLIVAGGLGLFAWQAKLEREQIKANIKVADELSQQAGILQQKNYPEASKDALAQAGLSLTLKDPELKQALSWSGIALTHQYLGQRSLETEDNKPIKEIKYNEQQLEHWQKAQDAIINSLNLLKKEDLTSTDVVPIAFFTYSVLGNLLEEHEFASSQLQQELLTTSIFPSTSPKTALDAYKEALKIPEESSPPVAESPDLETIDNVSNVYRELSDSLSSDSDTDETRKQRDNLRNLMLASMKKHYLYLTHARILALEIALKELDWKKADSLTWNVIFYSAQSKNIEGGSRWTNTSCSDFRKIETLWYNQSNGKFSFKEQWKIYSRLNDDSPDFDFNTYEAFAKEVGWYTEGKGWKNYDDLNWLKNSPTTSPKGHLPSYVLSLVVAGAEAIVRTVETPKKNTQNPKPNYFSLSIACVL